MRRSKGTFVVILTGVVVVILIALSWKDIYCQFFLDPRLVGRWKSESAGDSAGHLIDFDRVGNFQDSEEVTGRYRLDGKALVTVTEVDGEDSPVVSFYAYRIEGDSLALASPKGVEIFRRVADDSP